MAATAGAARLTEAHRMAQLRLGAQTALQLLAVWPVLDATDLDGTFRNWLRAVVPVIGNQRRSSARLAANYITTFRSLELGVGIAPIVATLAEDVDMKALTTSMLVTGPVSVKSAMTAGTNLTRAMETAAARAAGAGMRHALSGGRDTITTTVEHDRRALGWARATSGKTCHFCAMLASRGPAYKSDKTADFRTHDHCNCTVEPVYRDDSKWPAGAERYRQIWDEATDGLSGADAIDAFRQKLAG